jgi:hypothetical protein
MGVGRRLGVLGTALRERLMRGVRPARRIAGYRVEAYVDLGCWMVGVNVFRSYPAGHAGIYLHVGPVILGGFRDVH